MAKINIFALGGLDEKAKNMYVLEIDSKMYIIDAGINEPVRDDFGVQQIIPKLDYLKLNSDKIKGIFLSTPAKYQLGAIWHVVKLFPNIPIHTSDVTSELIKLQFGEKFHAKLNMNIMKSGEEAVVSNIPVKAYTISAAVPGTFAFVFKTKDGNIVYATDYISDETPQLETDHNLFLDDMSKEKNLVFMSDSFNSKLDGFVSPKHSIKDYIINQLDSDARVVASIYEDELVNVYELIQLSAEYNKKIYIFDKKIFEMLNFIMDKGYFAKLPLELYKPGIEKKNSIVVITGTRTDLYQTLKRIIQEDDIDTFNITKEDTIFLASPPQPGNEHIYAGIGNDLSVFNPDVISVHIKDKNTFHPAKGDLDRFIKKINPKHFMPIKGWYMFLAEGAKVSKENGIHEKQTIIGDNGDMFTFENGNYQGLTRKIREVGDQYIELSSDDKIDTQVIEERVNLAKDGIVTIGLIINPQTKRAISNVDIQLKGVVFIRGQEKLLKTLSDQILDILRQEREGTFQIPKVIARIKKEITKELRATIKKAPDLIIKIEELK